MMKRLKLNRKEKLLFATPLLVLILPLAAILGPKLNQELQQDALDKAMRRLAGPHATDCSGVAKDAPLTAPVLAAYKSGKPFFARFRLHGDNSIGIAMTPQGQVYMLNHQRGLWRTDGKVDYVGYIAKLKWNAKVALEPVMLPDEERNQLLQD